MSNKNHLHLDFFRGKLHFKKLVDSDKFNSQGFTFIETLASLFVIMIGISSFYILINQTVSYTKSCTYDLIAAYLGKEGIELAKNLRDSNFLAVHYNGTGSWTDGMMSCPTGSPCQTDYSISTFIPYNNSALKLQDTNPKFFNHSSGTDTIFKRKITIDPIYIAGPEPDYLNVKVEVIWNEKGRNHSMTIQERLYPWW